MTALYVICGILLFIFLLLLCPVRVCLDYTDELSVMIRFLFLKFRISPPDKEKIEKEDKEEKKEKPPETGSRKKGGKKKKAFWHTLYEEEGFSGALHFLKVLADILKGAAKGILSHLVIRLMDVRMAVVGENAANTAILYGKVCSAVFPLLTWICSCAKVRKYHADIRPDFIAPKSSAAIALEFSILPIFVLTTGAGALYSYIKNILLARNKQKQGGAEI